MSPDKPIALPSGEPERERYEAEEGMRGGRAVAIKNVHCSGGSRVPVGGRAEGATHAASRTGPRHRAARAMARIYAPGPVLARLAKEVPALEPRVSPILVWARRARDVTEAMSMLAGKSRRVMSSRRTRR